MAECPKESATSKGAAGPSPWGVGAVTS